jgi:hypothetical protein
MKTTELNHNGVQGGLVDGPRLLEQLFPDPVCRPSLRWLRTQVANRTIPFCRIGRLCFFSPPLVKSHFDASAMKKVRVA